MATVLVTGGSGFFGSVLVRHLSGQPDVQSVISYDLQPPKHAVPGVSSVTGSITDTDRLTAACEGVDCVFHVASVVNVLPYPSQLLHEVNVRGTESCIEACRRAGVPRLVYTSTMDVVYSGQPLAGGDETAPFPASFFNPYIETKGRAETAVLAACGPELHTVALRPAHIYGPGDAMIVEILHAVKGGLPFRFGGGCMDFVFVENLAHAHCLAWRALADGAGPGGAQAPCAGQAMFIKDFQRNMWEQQRPYLAAAALSPPGLWLPLGLLYGAAAVLEAAIMLVFHTTGYRTPVTFCKYVVLAAGQDFWFTGAKARTLLSYAPLVDEVAAEAKTVAWVQTLPSVHRGARGAAAAAAAAADEAALEEARGRRLSVAARVLNWTYGLVYVALGLLLFYLPAPIATAVQMPVPPLPSAPAVIAQTCGLIVLVLGVYNIAALVLGFRSNFFWWSVIPKAATAGLVLLMAATKDNELLHLLAAGEAVFAVGNLLLNPMAGLTPTSPDAVSAAQLLHAVPNTVLHVLLFAAPTLVVPVLFSTASATELDLSFPWACLMGALEVYMTWLYGLSGLIRELEPFCALSVFSRLFALAFLWANLSLGRCSMQQALGVLPDGLFAALTWWALSRRRRAVPADKQDTQEFFSLPKEE